jgi:outer membrane protein OmpU
MKYVLFASTALATVALGGMASAQGVTIFGEARGGLLYNEGLDNELQTTMRYRFGVRAEVETDSGITVGGEARADNAIAANDGLEGNFWFSGAYGTLTFGDTAGADEYWVGDVPGNLSLTGLGDENETVFLTNGGDFGDTPQFDLSDDDALARPTIRYDFEIAGFGGSLSSNRTLQDWAIGLGYDFETGWGGFNVGLGYAQIASFEDIEDVPGTVTVVDVGGADQEIPTVTTTTTEIKDIDSFSAGLGATFDTWEAGVTYIKNKNDDGDFDILNVGAETFFGAFGVGAFFSTILSTGGDVDSGLDGNWGWAGTADYDLGGGARVAGGFGQSRNSEDWIGDFGVKIDF